MLKGILLFPSWLGLTSCKRMKTLLFLAFGTYFGLIAAIAKDKQATAYNLLNLQTDEHNFKTLGCYGGKIVQTPNIDWIGDNGAICTSFYALSLIHI